MSKEEILHNHVDAHCWLKSNCLDAALDAMDEYAKQEAIGFGEFLANSGKYLVKGNVWLPNPPSTTEQLYNLFLQSKNKQA